MMMDEILTGSVREISGALKGLASEYGSDVIDLSLLAIRLEATQSIIVGLLLLAAFSVYLFFTVPWVIRNYNNEERMSEITVWFFTSGFFTIIVVGRGFPSLTLSNFAAALGYPEILIATNILKSSGVL